MVSYVLSEEERKAGWECWADMLAECMQKANDPGPVIACTLSPAAMSWPFDSGFGGTCGEPFTAWTRDRVYFPVCYDGAEWVGSAPRHPCDEATEHVGGG